jgi:serine/threonine protein kinase
LHRAGICHRNLGLESFLLQDDQDIAILNDFEFACRIPYARAEDDDDTDDDDNTDDGPAKRDDADITTMRRLILPEKICGKPLYLAPEQWDGTPFDGVAIDLWAMGTMLLVMLTGCDPWAVAQPSDAWYNFIVVQGQLEEALRLKHGGGGFGLGHRTLSASVVDLLQKILQPDPRDRPSLYEVQHHPWVQGD